MDDRQLRTVWQNLRHAQTTSHLSEPLAVFMKHTLAKRVKQLGSLAQAWDEVVPDAIRDHAALESYRRGALTVVVDSAAHRFELEILLRSGLQHRLAERFGGALSKVRVVAGQFASVDIEGFWRYAF